MSLNKFRELIYNTHDNKCNQKYAKVLPYSTHLGFVEAQGIKFMHLLPTKLIQSRNNYKARDVYIEEIVLHALIAHDCIEDARMSYNDLLEAVNTEEFGNYEAAKMVADIVYCVTDEKGKNRIERKNDKYYQELKENKLAVYVKLSDLAANTLFSKLSGSSMYDRYKKEWSSFKKKLYIAEYEDFFNYIEKI